MGLPLGGLICVWCSGVMPEVLVFGVGFAVLRLGLALFGWLFGGGGMLSVQRIL